MAQIYIQETSSAKEAGGIVADLTALVAVENRNNLSPVFQTPIDQHNGIRIKGQFKTNDGTDYGKTSYITVKRNEDVAVPYDGYGIAWRKGNGTEYNLYIVDNDALSNDVFVTEGQMWDQSGGVNQFLAAAAIEILIDTWYEFVIDINAKAGIDCWIYEAATPPAELNNGNRVIYRGQTYPEYLTQSAGDHFGVSVIDSANYEWWYKELKITSIIETYPMQLYKLKCRPENFTSGEAFSLSFYGVGYGDTEDSLKWYARNQNTSEWDLAGLVTAGPNDTLNDMKSVKSLTDIDDYRDANDYVNILATPYNYNDDEHILRSYYVGATNVLLSGIHRGNMTDIYVNAKDKYATESISVVLSGPLLVLNTVDGVQFPVADIVGISRTLTGIEYTENTEYSVTRPTLGDAFSNRDDIQVVFADSGIAGVSVDILYRYYSDGASAQALLDSDEYRYVGTDNLLKITPPTLVNLNTFEYKGDVIKEDMQAALATYINDIEDGSLEITDLINTAYTAGATYVSLVSLDITVKEHDYTGTYTSSSVTNSMTISGLQTFFADTTSLIGVSKVG